ncbi:hypothetical protein C1645_737669 [Glomus cerebriforme]|uniref:F-box domain-containing protein n=1 Tax=Glomus cerebriforme TaxID=658196 RepID=A0A397T6R6_9GLOM|nr:hypothetical protein C1645_737669 [Glomus cerebriforme]
MAATLPELCIRFVLEELNNDTRSKHACILINRHWCMASIHEIWKHPLYYCQELEQKERYIQFIDTYIKCLTQQVKETLGLKSDTKSAFDYTAFSQWICPNGLRSCVKLWLDEKIKQDYDNYSTLLKSENKTILMIGKALCEHLIVNSKKLIGIQLNQNEINIFELPQAEKVLSKVTHFITRFSCEPSRIGKLPNILSFATEISNNIQVLNITCFNVEKEYDISIQNLSQLIKNQKRLKEFTLTYWNPGFLNLWKSVLQQNNTLTTIILETIIFNETNPFLLHELSIFKNLQVLTIENCKNFNFSNKEIDISYSFRKLKKFTVVMSQPFPRDFIMIVLQQSNENLRKVEVIDMDIKKDVLPYCIKHFTRLLNFSCSINFENFNLILSLLKFSKNLETLYVNELEDYLINEDFDFLCSLGEHFPKSLYYFTFDLDWEFNNNTFSKFLKICKEKGINFRTLIFAQSAFFNDSYLYELLKFYGERNLDELVLNDMNNFSKECLKEVKKQVGIVKFAKGYPEKFNLSINFEEVYER